MYDAVRRGALRLGRRQRQPRVLRFGLFRNAQRLAHQVGRGPHVLDRLHAERDLVQLDDLAVRELPRRV